MLVVLTVCVWIPQGMCKTAVTVACCCSNMRQRADLLSCLSGKEKGVYPKESQRMREESPLFLIVLTCCTM